MNQNLQTEHLMSFLGELSIQHGLILMLLAPTPQPIPGWQGRRMVLRLPSDFTCNTCFTGVNLFLLITALSGFHWYMGKMRHEEVKVIFQDGH